MREAGVQRLSSLKLSRNARDYLVMHYLIRDLEDVIAKYAKGKVLDIGCGNKPYEPLFHSTVDSYTGSDVVQSSLNKVDVICPATELAFESNQFDTVFSTQVIEHVGDPFKMISEANRVLKTGGHIILSAPFVWELHEEPYDFYRYSKYGLQYMLQQQGFELVQLRANGGKWAAIAQLNLNIIYSSFTRPTFFRRLLKGIFVKCRLTAALNSLALWLDRKYFDELLTLNYVVVAKKTKSN